VLSREEMAIYGDIIEPAIAQLVDVTLYVVCPLFSPASPQLQTCT